MVTIEQLREWAKVTGSAYDTTLRTIEAGVLALLEQATNRTLVSPPALRSQILSAPAPPRAGLSRLDATGLQRVRIRDEVQTTLTGVVTLTEGSTTVTGTSTKALTQLLSGAVMTVAGVAYRVDTIASDTSWTIVEDDPAVEEDATSVAATMQVAKIEIRYAPSDDWEEVDARDYEIESGVIHTTGTALPAGPRTVRVTYLVGYDEGSGPADITLLLLRMVQTFFTAKNRQATSINLDGAFTVQWADFGDSAEELLAAAKALCRPIGFGY